MKIKLTGGELDGESIEIGMDTYKSGIVLVERREYKGFGSGSSVNTFEYHAKMWRRPDGSGFETWEYVRG